MKTNLKSMKAALNAQAKSKAPTERANSFTCRVYADAHHDAGDEPTAALWQKVADFLDTWHENGRMFWHYEHVDYDATEPKTAIDRNKLIALDHGSSGAFLVEKATGTVFQIRGYGKKGRPVGHIDALIARYREANEENRMRAEHVKGGRR